MSPEKIDRNQKCLRCADVELTLLSHSSPELQRFDCPSCHRRYARKPRRSLTFAWLHPVSLPLYAVLFDSDPLSRVSQVADLFIKEKPRDELRRTVEEIELELASPTQQVRDILDNPQTEELCRAFLRALVMDVREKRAIDTR